MMESTSVPMPKRIIGIALAAVCIGVSYFLPGSEALSHEGIVALGLLVGLVCLWVTAALPLGVIALLITVLLALLGVVPTNEAFAGFASRPLLLTLAPISRPRRPPA